MWDAIGIWGVSVPWLIDHTLVEGCILNSIWTTQIVLDCQKKEERKKTKGWAGQRVDQEGAGGGGGQIQSKHFVWDT